MTMTLNRVKLYDIGEHHLQKLIDTVVGYNRNIGARVKKMPNIGTLDRAQYLIEGLEEFGSKEHMIPAMEYCRDINFSVFKDDFNGKISRYRWKVSVPWKWLEDEHYRTGGRKDLLETEESIDETISPRKDGRGKLCLLSIVMIIGFFVFFVTFSKPNKYFL